MLFFVPISSYRITRNESYLNKCALTKEKMKSIFAFLM